MKTIHDLIAAQAQQSPQADAILDIGRNPLTYARLYQHLQNTRQVLNSMGLRRTDRVAIVLPNGPEMAAAFLAVSASCVSAPLNPNYRSSEFDFYLSDLKVSALLTLQGLDTPAIESACQLDIPIIELIPDIHGAGHFKLSGSPRSLLSQPGFAEEDETALLLHTSGATSRPKIVPLSQRNLVISAGNIRTTLQLTGTTAVSTS